MRKRVHIGQLSNTKGQMSFIGTFHSFGAKVLRENCHHFNRTPRFTIFDEDDSLTLCRQVCRNLNLDKEKYNPIDLAGQITEFKNELIRPDPTTVEGKVFYDYEASLEENNGFDFDDLIEKPIKLLREKAGILKKYQEQYQYILIDEYQDVNAAQYQLVKLLAGERANLSVVGDDQQAIYGWRGADFRNFLNFDKDWPAAKVVLLEENYRSTPNILRAANEIIKNNKFQRPKRLWTQKPEGEPIVLFAAQEEHEEADWLAGKIRQLWQNQGHALEGIALIYRTNAQSRALEQALIAEEVPYRIFGGIRFYERKEIKDILAGLRLAQNPKDQLSIERLVKNFPQSKTKLLVEQLPRLAQELTLIQLINYFLNHTDYFQYLERRFRNSEEREENVKELINFAASFVDRGLTAFLEQVSLAQAQDAPAGERGVNLMTIHLAKGLEFDTVFIAGCNEGTLPHHRSYNTEEELEEERRLMYVAVTRASQRLFLSFNKIPSRFLYEIPPELVLFINQNGRAPARGREGWSAGRSPGEGWSASRSSDGGWPASRSDDGGWPASRSDDGGWPASRSLGEGWEEELWIDY